MEEKNDKGKHKYKVKNKKNRKNVKRKKSSGKEKRIQEKPVMKTEEKLLPVDSPELKARVEQLRLFVTSPEYVPMKRKEMALLMSVPVEERGIHRQAIHVLLDQGICIRDGRGRIVLAGENLSRGRFCATQHGYGFVTIEGEEDDLFIPESATGGAFQDDIVLVRIGKPGGTRRREGRIVQIVERGITQVVGTYEKSRNFGFVVADNPKFAYDIFIPKSQNMGAVTGHKVVVDLVDYGNSKKSPEGKVVEILGHVGDPGVDILSIVRAFGLPEEFPEEEMKLVRSIPEEIDSQATAGRTDLRNLVTVTIDGEDAKDLDDAISLSVDEKGYHLGVHIADVSEYVRENSAIDKEALTRGTSVYLVDRVIPMLPHALSNGICSLNEDEDRLALSCLMEIDKDGHVTSHRIVESVIHSNRRMTYTAVKKILTDHDEEECKQYQELVPMFEQMQELAALLSSNRRKQGSIDFDFPESKIILDKDGHPTDIKPYERNVATRLIEEFMLITNETVAQDYFWQEVPFVYRSHEHPDTEKMQQLSVFIHNFGYHMKHITDEMHPKEIQKLMDSIADTPEENMIARLTLRSMKRARYTTDCDGHFGLATRYYCHFTSPIRRYPDLQIHRIIKENLHTGIAGKRREHYENILDNVASESSRLERRADDAEREVEKMKKAEYMLKFRGKEFDGVVSGLTAWGMYVELPNTVEGMIRLTDMPGDSYRYEADTYQLVGERTRRTYTLGQPVRIRVAGVSMETHTIDFDIVQEEDDGEGYEETNRK